MKRAKDRTGVSAALRNRIVAHADVNPATLKENPKQWKLHEKAQTIPLEALLEKVGWVQQVVVNKASGYLVDGHARVELAKRRGEKKIPVVYVNLSPKEEELVLALLDPLTGLATAHDLNLEKLLKGLDPGNLALEALVAKLEADLGLAEADGVSVGGDGEVLLDQAVQLEPQKEYVVVFCDDEEEFLRLRKVLDLKTVRRGGYKAGSPFDAKSVERVIRAERLFSLLKKKNGRR